MSPDDRQIKSEWLKSVRWHVLHIGELEEERQHIVDRIRHIRKKYARYADERIEMEKERLQRIDKEIDEVREKAEQIIQVPGSLEDPRHALIVREYDIEGKPIQDVANMIGYSVGRVKHLHGDALDLVTLPEGHETGTV